MILLLLIIYSYSLLVLLFYLEIDRDPDPRKILTEHPTDVSIVVPVRNEEENLSGLLEDLSGQSYPAAHMEIIFVDDHSSDASASILESVRGDIAQFSYLPLPLGKSGKKQALAHGIKHAKYDRIIQVDADCRLGPGFVGTHMGFLENHPSDLVAGIVSTERGRGGFLEVFERLDMLALIGTAAGSFNLGRPMMCSGANLSYTRDLFWETRSFDPVETIASGDDMFLMIGARKLGRTLSFISDRESIVRTSSSNKLCHLIRQRIRWGSKTPGYQMLDIQLLAVLVSLANITILLMPFWIILFLNSWPWLAGAWIMKTLADFMLLHRMTGLNDSRSELRWFLPVSLLYHPFFMVNLLGALRGRSVWKKESR